MQSLDLILFEMKKQVKSISFIIITAIIVVFAITQMGEIFHYPVNSDKDISYLQKHGESDYLYVDASSDELRESTIDFLSRSQAELVTNGGDKISADALKKLVDTMKEKNLTFDEAYKFFSKENPDLVYWLDSCKEQFGKRIGTKDEINNNMKIKLGREGYNVEFFKKYVTYIQLITALLILPLFVLLFTKDSRYNMNEIVFVQPMSSNQYILCKYAGCLIPLLLVLYVVGEVINIYITYRFKAMGWRVVYSSFIGSYLTFIVPTILFLSSLIMFLALILKKAIAVFPLYIIYVIFNATESAFLGQKGSNAIYKCIVRLDEASPYSNFVSLNRVVYLVLTLILIVGSCVLYEQSRKKSKGAVTL